MPISTITVFPYIQAAEPSTNGAFRFVRNPGEQSPLTVNYSVSGTATSDVDYQALAGTVTFGAMTSIADVQVFVTDDFKIEGAETVIVTIQPDAAYIVGDPSSATITIADNDGVQGTSAPATCPMTVD